MRRGGLFTRMDAAYTCGAPTCMHACVQVDMLRPRVVGSYDEFGERYCMDQRYSSASTFPGSRYRGEVHIFDRSNNIHIPALLFTLCWQHAN